ncbi:MAG TPA: NepR family anti-sigma factor [Novosphingobium sp.]|nr:NepR family anti-sigma factor [Novosphingobium sp.]
MKTIGHQRQQRGRQATPDWASGLRRLYDSVVEEPLPDSFAKLLDDLDGADD